MTEPVLTVAWLVLAHLVADFVLQNDWIAMNKGSGGGTGWAALGMHGLHVGLCLLPAILVWGLQGLAYVIVVVASHILVDRWKVRATRSADSRAQAQARARLERGGPQQLSGLGSAWSPMPGLLFLADQVFHLTFAIVGWVVILAGASLMPQFVDALDTAFRSWDRASVHAVILTGVVLLSVLIVNTRGAFYFVMALASPREVMPVVVPADAGSPAVAPAPGVAAPAPAAPALAPAAPALTPVAPTGAAGRVAATVAAFERILVFAFVVTGAQVAVAAVIAFDLVARFRHLEDRRYVEHYLLSTFASLSVAVGSGLVALAALSTLG